MILSSLVKTYDRMASRGEVPVFGYSLEKVSFLISLDGQGKPVGKPHDLRRLEQKKLLPAILSVPQPPKKASGIIPNFLWDKTSYVLGVTAKDGKRTAQEHAAFVERHRAWLSGTADAGLLAFLAFFDGWSPERFTALGWPEEMLDQNIVFALESERLDRLCLHDRPAAVALWVRLASDGEGARAICLVSGDLAPVARLHPSIKGVWGAQSSGASIVSFNKPAYESYGHEQGDNAPVSVAAAFAYTTALNTLLDRSRGQCLQIGDASVVFWAEAEDVAAAEVAEAGFAAFWQADETAEAKPIGTWLDRLRQGRPQAEWAPAVPEVRFHVLALAPNAARLSIRFYIEDDFRVIASRYAAHQQRLRVEPPPPQGTIAFWRMAQETAVLGKHENIDPHLAGDWLRAILTGAPYPLTLLSTLIMRIRADHAVNGLRVAMLKSVLIRNFNRREVPVAFDPAFKDPGYLLGRLFAVYEQIQLAALGTGVNATIRDKFYGAASSQPRKVFHLLDSGSANHLSKIGKQSPGRRVNLEKALAGIMELMDPAGEPYPASLPDKSQALFALGYYHQKNEFFRKAEEPAKEDAAA